MRWPEPRIQSCCPQPPNMILSACLISSMYSSAEATSNILAPFKSSPQWRDYAISKDRSHMHLPLWISMHPKGKTPYSKNGSTHRTKPFIRNFVRKILEKHKLKGNWNKHLHKSSGITCLKYPESRYSFRGAAEGGKLKAKKHSTTMHQVKVEVVAMYMLESNMFNP